jgi:hypothetical protein
MTVHNKQLGTIQAYCVQDFDEVIQELVQIYRASKRDVTKVTLAVQIGVLARRTNLAALNYPEARIEHASGNWVITLVCLVCDDLYDRTTADLLRRRNAKLNANN